MATKRMVLLDQWFYFVMALIVAAVVAYGFSQTIDENLLHPASPRPFVLYVHGAVFAAWVVLFITQSALIRSRNVAVHRRLGLGGIALGTAIPVVGIATAISMGRWHVLHGAHDAAAFLIVPFFDMSAFVLAFGLAIGLRKRPEYHRRLMLVATCGLAIAAFFRFPATIIPDNWAYAAVDVLLLCGVARDLAVTGRVHPVYLVGVPLLAICQAATMYVFVAAWPPWLAVASAMLGQSQ